MKRHRALNRKTTVSAGLLLLATLLVSYGLWGLQQRYAATHSPQATIPHGVVADTTATPDESSAADACKAYKVPADQPHTIELPTLGASGCIQKVGLDRHSAVSTPTNIHVAGWYVDSVVPGAAGVSLIDGHVQGRYADGIFKKLDQLQLGDPIQIRMGNGELRDFTVVHSDVYTADVAAHEMLKPVDGIEKQLTLITCGGAYNKQAKTYDKRVVVRARLAE